MAKEPCSEPLDRADSNSIGARSGRIGLADAASLYGMSPYEREKMEDSACRTPHTTNAMRFQSIKMSNGVHGISFGTGGTGGFSAYWALDAEEAPIALYFDLPHLATTHQGECAIPILSNSQISFEHTTLAKAGITVRLGMDGASQCFVITPRECWAKIAVSDASHRVTINFDDHFGSSSSPEENCSYLPPDFDLPVGGLLHVRWNTGHSYEFAAPFPETTSNTPEAFGALWHRCGCNGDGSHWQERLKACYESYPARQYHNWRHLTECLRELDEAKIHFRYRDLNTVEMALWFHDAVYEPRAQDSEEKSAEGAVHILREGKASESFIEKVSALIMATKTHPHKADPDTALLLDIDLSILGQPPERYLSYENAIRSEYQWVPFAIFAHERRKILTRFLERESIYLTPYFRDRYEAQARVNLSTALERLPTLPV
jgi:predicted metal-dependent HD superfamily phosphohydrolase